MSFLYHRHTFLQVEVELETNSLLCMFIHYKLNGSSGRVGRSKPASYFDQTGHFTQGKLMEGF